MSAEITLHTGTIGDQNKLHINWHDENNVPQLNDIEIDIEEQDKPRTLVIRVQVSRCQWTVLRITKGAE